MSTVHISPYIGDWYPADASALDTLLDERFSESVRRIGPFLPSDPLGLVVPHASPEWSGAVAAAAYRALACHPPEHVILLAFPHRGGLGRIATPELHAVRTPFGDTSIDTCFQHAFPTFPEWRLCDHSFEIQLPYLQRVAPNARVTPLYVGSIDSSQRARAAEILSAAWRPGVVFVASSDFTHFGRNFGFQPFPNDSFVAERLRDLDFECVDGAAGLDAEWFLETLARNRATVCGSEPIALLLEILRRIPGAYQTVFDYQTSGEMSRDFDHSVSYAALGYYHRSAFELSGEDGRALLASAAETLRILRATGRREPVPAAGSAALSARRGAFVSLHSGDELLGCVGNLLGRNSLAEDIADLTLSAALEDPRFRPAAETAGSIEIEISVLTPLRPIRDVAEFRVETHGAVLTLGHRSGLLLPQVARERGWETSDFLKALAHKSGLWVDAWRDPKAQLAVFEAQVIRS
jgi:AmmeMemoRadiSam system protein B/AmmeMemoRadiSam system protein A